MVVVVINVSASSHPSWHLKSVNQLAIPPCWLCGCHQLGGIPAHPTIQHREGSKRDVFCVGYFYCFEKQLATINRLLFNDIVVWIINKWKPMSIPSFSKLSHGILHCDIKRGIKSSMIFGHTPKSSIGQSSRVFDGVQRMVWPISFNAFWTWPASNSGKFSLTCPTIPTLNSPVDGMNGFDPILLKGLFLSSSTASNSASLSSQNFVILIFCLYSASLERLALRRFEIGCIVVVLSSRLLIVIIRNN